MVDLLKSLFPNAQIKVFAYVALNYDKPAEAREGQGNTSHRGIALFQVGTRMVAMQYKV